MALLYAVMHLVHPGTHQQVADDTRIGHWHVRMPEIEADHIEQEHHDIDTHHLIAGNGIPGQVAEHGQRDRGDDVCEIEIEDDLDRVHAVGGDRRHHFSRVMHLVKFPQHGNAVMKVMDPPQRQIDGQHRHERDD